MGIDPDALERFEVLEAQMKKVGARIDAMPTEQPLLDQLNQALFDAVARRGDAQAVLTEAIAFARAM